MDRRTLLATLASGAAVTATPFARAQESDSYTHLTLPRKRIV